VLVDSVGVDWALPPTAVWGDGVYLRNH